MQLIVFVGKGNLLFSSLFIAFCQECLHTGLHFFSKELFLLLKLLPEFILARLIVCAKVEYLLFLHFLETLDSFHPLTLHLLESLFRLLFRTLQQPSFLI